DQGAAGQDGRVYRLTGVRLGDRLGAGGSGPARPHFAPPTLETTVVARDRTRQLALHAALTELAGREPLIRLRPDDRGGSRISIYGEVQQQVIADTLSLEHGIEVDFRSATVICVQRPAGPGSAALRIGDPDHLLGYTLGVTVPPGRPGPGVAPIPDS